MWIYLPIYISSAMCSQYNKNYTRYDTETWVPVFPQYYSIISQNILKKMNSCWHKLYMNIFNCNQRVYFRKKMIYTYEEIYMYQILL